MGPPRAESGNRFGSSRMGLAQNQFLQPEIVTKASGSPYTYLYIMVRWICMRPMILQHFACCRDSCQKFVSRFSGWINLPIGDSYVYLFTMAQIGAEMFGSNGYGCFRRAGPTREINDFLVALDLQKKCEEWGSIAESRPMHRAKTIWFRTFKINK